MPETSHTPSVFFELIQLSVGVRRGLSCVPSADDWHRLYGMASKHALLGVCFLGVKAVKSQGISVPAPLYMQWLAAAAGIQQRNEMLNRRCREVQEMAERDGFRSCVLKGQGNTMYYDISDLALLRQPGDIDLWMEGGYSKIIGWVQRKAPTREVTCHHAHFHCFGDAEVEVHFCPSMLPNPFHDKVLQKYYGEQAERQFVNKVRLKTGEEIVAADTAFNIVFQLVHIHHHLITEGIGLRQLMDYYFLLLNVGKEMKEEDRKKGNDKEKGQDTEKWKDTERGKDGSNRNDTERGKDTEREKEEFGMEEFGKNEFGNDEIMRSVAAVSELGLGRFASALMWVLGEVFGMKKENMLWEADETDGRFLLDEIMQSGNFGRQDTRQRNMYRSKWNSFWTIHFKTFRFRRFDRWAWLWSPLFRIRWKVWQMLNGYTN